MASDTATALRCSTLTGTDPEGLKEIPQRRRRLLGLGEVLFEPVHMRGDELIASFQIGCGVDGLDLLQRHFQDAKAPDDLGGRDLLGDVAAVTCVGVDVGRLRQADAVVLEALACSIRAERPAGSEGDGGDRVRGSPRGGQ
jgi:hypothetical protein